MRSPPTEENHECAGFSLFVAKKLFFGQQASAVCELQHNYLRNTESHVGFVDPGQITGSFCRHQIVNVSDVDVEIRKCKNNSQYQILIIEHMQLKFNVHRSRLLRAEQMNNSIIRISSDFVVEIYQCRSKSRQ